MDAVSVAVPIFGPDRGVVASVSPVVQAEGARPHAVAPTVRAAARGISRALGALAAPETSVIARNGRGDVCSTGCLFKLSTMSHVYERPVR